MKKTEVLANLSYFSEWGGLGWERLCLYALQNMGDLDGKTILEIGPNSGRMSACFALLGAQIVGVETNASALKQAQEEIKQWGVQARVSFHHYDGDLDHCEVVNESKFDFIFTKSVLVALETHLLDFFEKLDRTLKPDGNCVLIENRHGGSLFSFLRSALLTRELFIGKSTILSRPFLPRLIDQHSI